MSLRFMGSVEDYQEVDEEHEMNFMAAMRKASFGGDRSEAGRYAANVRWQGNVKEKNENNDASQRLLEEFQKEQGKIPNSPPNPQGLNARAIYSWVEGPFRSSSRNYPINDRIRHIASGLFDLPLPKYNSYKNRGGFIDPRIITEQTKNLIESIDKAEPKQPVLWRGLKNASKQGDPQSQQQEQVMALQIGDTFVSPIFSTSRSKDVATFRYAIHETHPDSSPAIVFRIEAGSKGLRTSIIPDDYEVLTGGKFEVTARTESTIKIGKFAKIFQHKVIVIGLRQVDTFGIEDYKNPSFTPDYSYEKTS